MSGPAKAIKFDLSEWDWGDWPERLVKATKVDVATNPYGDITVTINSSEGFEAVVQGIVEEALQVYFTDDVFADITEDGVKITGIVQGEPDHPDPVAGRAGGTIFRHFSYR